MPPLRPLRQGTKEQRSASAPSRGAAQSLLLQYKSQVAQGRNFSGSRLTLARRSSCLHGRNLAVPISSFDSRYVGTDTPFPNVEQIAR